jgi:hypothetical protein
VTLAGKLKLVKALVSLVFKLTGKPNEPSVLKDAKATLGLCTLTIMTILWLRYGFDLVIAVLVPVALYVLAHPNCPVF